MAANINKVFCSISRVSLLKTTITGTDIVSETFVVFNELTQLIV
jgi:hypothetical protein